MRNAIMLCCSWSSPMMLYIYIALNTFIFIRRGPAPTPSHTQHTTSIRYSDSAVPTATQHKHSQIEDITRYPAQRRCTSWNAAHARLSRSLLIHTFTHELPSMRRALLLLLHYTTLQPLQEIVSPPSFIVGVYHPFIAPTHLQRLPYYNTIARPSRNVRPATVPPFVCHIPYNIGHGNIV